MVSDRERQVEHAGFDDPFTYSEQKKFLEVKNDMEHALHRGSAATGATNATSQFAGMLNLFSTNFSIHASVGADSNWTGVTLTESIFNDVLEAVYQNGSVQPEEVYCNSKIKRTISGFNTKTTFNLDAADKRQILATDWYVSDFGNLRIYLARDQTKTTGNLSSGDSTKFATEKTYQTMNPANDNSFIVIDPRYFMTGWLQTVRRETLSRDGLRDRFQISGALTLIAKSEKAGGGGRGFSANI